MPHLVSMDLTEIEAWWQRVQAPSLSVADLADIVGAPDVHLDDHIDCIPERARFARTRVLGVRVQGRRWISGFDLGFRSPEPLMWTEVLDAFGKPERVISRPPKWGAPLMFVFRAQRYGRSTTMTAGVAWFDADLSKVDGAIAHVASIAFARLPGPTDLLEDGLGHRA